MASTVVHVLAERGELDYDLHVADVWPEFVTHGKDTVTVRHLLCHTAGVPGLPPRRATGCTISELLRDLITGPLGIADEVRFGVPARLLPRVATQIDPEGLPESPPEPGSPQSPSMPTVIIPALDHQGATDE